MGAVHESRNYQRNDDIKRLFTLMAMLTNESMAISEQGVALARQALQDLATRTQAMIEEILTPGSPTFVIREKILQIASDQQRIDLFAKIVELIFWEEVRRQHPVLRGKPGISINSDWSLCWMKRN